ncbi:2-hydroxychromene-2-carboxylate isomerase [Neorhizobium lilium]|uniref:2-hydroxychromene-2-carboxylate isomerase n=1 Tax=Neorhizobium lilium TaxID=2503024 RepID=A0A444LB45_9HYPH|nr:2-hydroxychromene-2-carboxylate isomerase [Neorhizobium lilium]RWX74789.1 2-hydroxychromene-2-carboxylate isomerase [Neorhizobium lilium]
MRNVVDYYFSISSPWAYLGLERFQALVAEYGLDVRPFPITIIAENGAIASKDRPAIRRAYWQKEMLRWARHLGKTILLDNRPTSDWVPASFMIIAAELDGLDWIKLVGVMQERWWGHADDIGNAEVRKAIADSAGFDGAALLAREQDADVQAKWQQNLDRARDQGIFGSPTYVFDGEPYWGQDSLPFLKMHLSGEMVPSVQAAE